MRFWRKALIITSTLVVVTTAGYFIGQGIRFNNKIYSLGDYSYKIYQTLDKKTFINFGSLNKIGLYYDDSFHISDDYKYDENNLSIRIGEDSYSFYLLDSSTIYSSTFNKYFYIYEGDGHD